MTIDFTDPDGFVETVHNDYDENPSLSEEAPLDNNDLSEAGTENSVLDYGGEDPIGTLEDALQSQGVLRNLWTSYRPRCLRVHLW
jgi:hypothetical protein